MDQATRSLLADLARDYTILEDSRCRCGSEKTTGEPFCNKCFRVLPALHQKALRMARPARGFADAYRAALVSLGGRAKSPGFNRWR